MLTTLIIDAPIGPLTLVATVHALTAIHFAGSAAPDAPCAVDRDAHPILAVAAAELIAYFAGHGRDFTVPLDGGGTAFQASVWTALRQIPYGATCGYGALATAIGRPTAARAVGAANGANPIPIIVPCHRVIGADRTLTGYAGGLAIKQWLLAHEARHAGRQPSLAL